MFSQAPELVVAYDAGCGHCSRFKALVSFLDPRGRIKFVSLDAADEAGLLAAIEPASRYSSFHLLRSPSSSGGESGVRSGADAVLPLICSLPVWGRAVSRLLQATPGSTAGLRFAYAAVSRLHSGCGLGSGARGPTACASVSRAPRG